MKALVWHGKGDVRIDKVPDPVIEQPGDIVIEVTSTAICGSDLHLLDGYVPAMKEGDIMGHEFMGRVVEVGQGVLRHKVGDRVVVPFVLGCGHCFFCEKDLWSSCDNSNRDAKALQEMYGQAGAGLFGYSHLYGGYPGGQAEYVRVPYAQFGPIKIPDELTDEQVLFLSDIFPTAWQAAENANIQAGDTVAIWGCGPVGQLTIQSAWMMGAGRVIALDRVPERLAMAKQDGRTEVIDVSRDKAYDRLQEMTHGRGPDSCIDAVGFEAHGWGTLDAVMDKAKATVGLATDRIHVLREVLMCCRKSGTVSIPGVYAGVVDKMPFGAAFGKGLTLKMGQTHAQKYLKPLLAMIADKKIDPSFIITHRIKLDDAPAAYETFRDKKEGCVKVVMTP